MKVSDALKNLTKPCPVLARYFSDIVPRDHANLRVMLRVRLGSAKRAAQFQRQFAGRAGRLERGTFVVEGEQGPRIARKIGWPEEIVRAWERFEAVNHRGRSSDHEDKLRREKFDEVVNFLVS